MESMKNGKSTETNGAPSSAQYSLSVTQKTTSSTYKHDPEVPTYIVPSSMK